MMKRIHGWSLILGMVLALGLVGACTAWQNKQESRPSSRSSNNLDAAQNTSPSANTSKNRQSNNDNAAAQVKGDFATIDFRALPKEAQIVVGKIKAREDFPYRQDGQVFSNRERILPAQPKGYYHEYTVPTPGASNRGARRVVAGSGTTSDVATSGEYYYTEDHYRSFSIIKGSAE